MTSPKTFHTKRVMRERFIKWVLPVLKASRNTRPFVRKYNTTTATLSAVPGRISCNRQPSHWYLCSAAVKHRSTVADVSDKQTLQTRIVEDGKVVQVKWCNGQHSKFHAVWLRHSCHCPACRQGHSGQRVSEPVNPDFISLQSAQVSDDDSLVLKWIEDNHEGYIPLQYLQSHSYSDRSSKVIQHQTTHLARMEYEDLLKTEDGVLRWLRLINDYGMCLLKNVPTDDGHVIKVAEMIATVPKTIYGTLYSVESKDKPINIAYSSSELKFHQDLVYYESPPGLQFLHCTRFDSCVKGGESRLLNIISVTEQFRQDYPQHFEVLTRVPATFQKIHFDREDPVFMRYQRPHININHNKQIVNVTWAPPFEGPLSVNYDDVVPYYRAYHKFAEAVEKSTKAVEFRLEPGDIIIFNNRTVVHARNSFILNGGARILQGCYLNIDDFKRRLAVLSHLHGDTKPLQHVGNQCWFESENIAVN